MTAATTTPIVELRLKDAAGVDRPGVYRARITYRDKMFLIDQSLRSEGRVFEASYEVIARCLVGVVDVPGVTWSSNMDSVIEQIGMPRAYELASAIMAAGRLTEADRKN